MLPRHNVYDDMLSGIVASNEGEGKILFEEWQPGCAVMPPVLTVSMIDSGVSVDPNTVMRKSCVSNNGVVTCTATSKPRACMEINMTMLLTDGAREVCQCKGSSPTVKKTPNVIAKTVTAASSCSES